MVRNAEISVTPGDKQVTVKIIKTFQATENTVATADFSKPVIQFHNVDTNETRLQRIPLISGSTTVADNGTIKDATEVVITGLTNNQTYYVTYYQKGLGVDTTGMSATSAPARPHGVPAKPVIREISGGTVKANGAVSNFNDYFIGIELNDKDQSVGAIGEDLIEALYIYVSREQNKDKTVLATDLVTKTIKIIDTDVLTAARKDKKIKIMDDLLVAGAIYNFSVMVESDDLQSEHSNSFEAVMAVLPTAIAKGANFVLAQDVLKPNELKYTLKATAAAVTAGNYYEIYRENLTSHSNSALNVVDQGTVRTLVKRWKGTAIPTAADAVHTMTGTIESFSGQVVRLIMVPFSTADVMGAEIDTDAVMCKDFKNHMLEINLVKHSVIDGEGIATISFKASHKANELGYVSRVIKMDKLTNDEFTLSLPEDKDHTLATNLNKVVLTLDANGYVEKDIYLKKTTAADLDTITNKFTLAFAGGYQGVWSNHLDNITTTLDLNENLLSADVDSKDFNFPVTPAAPTVPTTLSVTALSTSIKVNWLTAGMTALSANKATSYVVGLVKNGGLDYNIATVSKVEEKIITSVDGNPDEYCEFIGLERLDSNKGINKYSVYIFSKNSFGNSEPAFNDAIELSTDELPSNYIEKFSVAVPSFVDQNTRKCTGKITINKSSWPTSLKEIVLEEQDDFGNAAAGGGFNQTILNANLTQVGNTNDFTFDFQLDGPDVFNLTVKATTSSRTAVPASGISAIAEKTSYKLYTRVDITIPPQIKEVKYSLDKTKKNTLYQIRINNGGSPLTNVSLIAIPSNESNLVTAPNNITQIVWPAGPKVLTYSNGEELYKVVIPYLVQIVMVDGDEVGVDMVFASNSVGSFIHGVTTGAALLTSSALAVANS